MDQLKSLQIVIATKSNKTRAALPSEVYAERISTSREIWISVMMNLCKPLLDGKISDEFQAHRLVPIFRETVDERNCNAYRQIIKAIILCKKGLKN